MDNELEHAHESLAAWCKERDYSGHDPFDALNSRIFQATPFKRSRLARLAWTQFLKRSPLSFRTVMRVPAERNAKGTALFALAALANFRRTRTKEAALEARSLLKELLAVRLRHTSGAAWGYNFDWQGRAFYAPVGTPTIVPTAFAARALTEAARDLCDEKYLKTARTVCDFILSDLPRSFESETEICWSYSPVDRTRVFNASLLAAETLAAVGALTGEAGLCETALRGARYVVNRQREDGSWAYGEEDYQSWADNFHTAFILTSLARIRRACPAHSDELEEAARRGAQFWRERFFLMNGWPKYFHDRLYPADAHSAGAAIIALLEAEPPGMEEISLAKRIAVWAVRNLRDPRGFFYYQRRRFYTVRTPYMRWSQAWMLYALARLREESEQQAAGGKSRRD
jgi:hypothetical protein